MDLAQTAKGYWRHLRFLRVALCHFYACFMRFSAWTCACFANNKTFRTFNKLLFQG